MRWRCRVGDPPGLRQASPHDQDSAGGQVAAGEASERRSDAGRDPRPALDLSSLPQHDGACRSPRAGGQARAGRGSRKWLSNPTTRSWARRISRPSGQELRRHALISTLRTFPARVEVARDRLRGAEIFDRRVRRHVPGRAPGQAGRQLRSTSEYRRSHVMRPIHRKGSAVSGGAPPAPKTSSSGVRPLSRSQRPRLPGTHRPGTGLRELSTPNRGRGAFRGEDGELWLRALPRRARPPVRIGHGVVVQQRTRSPRRRPGYRVHRREKPRLLLEEETNARIGPPQRREARRSGIDHDDSAAGRKAMPLQRARQAEDAGSRSNGDEDARTGLAWGRGGQRVLWTSWSGDRQV